MQLTSIPEGRINPIQLSSLVDGIDASINGFAQQIHQLIPAKQSHTFDKNFLLDVVNYLDKPEGDALYIAGPTGCGKTSGVLQVAAHLYWKVQQFTCYANMELSHLIGMYKLVSKQDGETPSMQFVYGALPVAMKYGHILLLNELDYADPGEVAGLNDVLEGRPLYIPETNQTIQPHENFRIIATGNSAGSGDDSGRYLGVNAQNMAFMDRFRVVKASYLPKDSELKALKNHFKDSEEIYPLLETMVGVANSVRAGFNGSDNKDGTLSVTMSTRTLIRWANVLQEAWDVQKFPVKYGLERALTNRCSDKEAVAITKIAKSAFTPQYFGE